MKKKIRAFFDSNSGVRLIRRIADSDLYPALFCLLAFMAYCSHIEILFAAILIALAAITLVFCENLKPILPPLFMFYFIVNLYHAPKQPTYSHYYSSPSALFSIGILVLVLLSALVFHLWLFGEISAMFRHKTRLTYFIIPLSIALLCNGLFAEGYAPINLTFALTTILIWFFLYLLFFFGLPRGKETIRYFCSVCEWTAILLILELIYVYITRDVLVEGVIIESRISFGWGINNNYGAVTAMLIPPLFYLAGTRKHGWIHFLLAGATYAAMVLSLCRAAMLVGTLIFGVCLIAVCCFGSNKGLFRIFLCMALTFLVGCVIFFREEILATFSSLMELGFSDEGRFALWRGGMEIFLRYPIFGGGFNTVSYHNLFHSWAGSAMPGLLHNTVIELFCATGAFGGISYLAYRARTVQLVLHRMTTERFFLGMVIAAIVGVGLLDNPMFIIYPTFYSTVALALVEGDYDDTMAGIAHQNKTKHPKTAA